MGSAVELTRVQGRPHSVAPRAEARIGPLPLVQKLADTASLLKRGSGTDHNIRRNCREGCAVGISRTQAFVVPSGLAEKVVTYQPGRAAD